MEIYSSSGRKKVLQLRLQKNVNKSNVTNVAYIFSDIPIKASLTDI